MTVVELPGSPLFDLSPELFDAVWDRDRGAMLKEVDEAGLLHLPFRCVALRFNMYKPANMLHKRMFGYEGNAQSVVLGSRKVIVTVFVSGGITLGTLDDYKGFEGEPQVVAIPEVLADDFIAEYPDGSVQTRSISEANSSGISNTDAAGYLRDMIYEAVGVLILSLLPEDTVRQELHHTKTKAWRREERRTGRAIGPTIISSHRISLPRIVLPEGPRPREGMVLVSRLRRGHKHTVLYGKGKSLRRSEWFKPVWAGVWTSDPTERLHEYLVVS